MDIRVCKPIYIYSSKVLIIIIIRRYFFIFIYVTLYYILYVWGCFPRVPRKTQNFRTLSIMQCNTPYSICLSDRFCIVPLMFRHFPRSNPYPAWPTIKFYLKFQLFQKPLFLEHCVSHRNILYTSKHNVVQ